MFVTFAGFIQTPKGKESQLPKVGGEDPVKGELRCAKWSVRAGHFVNTINKVLRTPISKRKAVWKQMMIDTELPLSVKEKLQIERFLDGRLVVWQQKQKIMTPTKAKPGFLTCAACESDHKFRTGGRMLLHLVSKEHQQKCREKLGVAEKELRQSLMDDHCAAAASKCRKCLIYEIVVM